MKGRDGVRAGGFLPDSAPPPPPAAAPASSAATPTSSVAMLVALSTQAPQPRLSTREKAERGIAALERLHRLLRAGVPAAAALDELARWQADADPADADLAELTREIELRILVELARAGR